MKRLAAFIAGCFGAVAFAQAPAVPDTFTRADKGNCIACHQLPEGMSPASRATLGPALSGVRMRELGRARVRALIVDPMAANPGTLMPPYGRHRILEPREIEQLVEFLNALP